MKIFIPLLLLALSPVLLTGEENGPNEEAVAEIFMEGERFSYLDNLMTVNLNYEGFPASPEGRVAVESLVVTIRNDPYWNSDRGKFLPQPMISIRGQGFAASALVINLEDERQISQFREVFDRALRMVERSREKRSEILAAGEERAYSVSNVSIPIGEVYIYPARKKMPATFEADYENGIYFVSIGNAIRLSPEVLHPLDYIMRNLDRYYERFQETPVEEEKFRRELTEMLLKED